MHLAPCTGLAAARALAPATADIAAVAAPPCLQVTAALPTVPTVHWDPLATFLKASLMLPSCMPCLCASACCAPWLKCCSPALLSQRLIGTHLLLFLCLPQQGGPLGSGDDPYYDAGRLGGTLSHLAREHPPTGKWLAGSSREQAGSCMEWGWGWGGQVARGFVPCCADVTLCRAVSCGVPNNAPPAHPVPTDKDRQALEGLPLEAVVTYDVPLRLAPRIQEGPCELPGMVCACWWR